jgi:hypothetical protein
MTNPYRIALLASVLSGITGMGTASATTAPNANNVFDLSAGGAVSMGTGVKARAWYDERSETTPGTANPAFRKLWTHNSRWGHFTVESGKTYNVIVVSSDSNVHPGISIWARTNLFDKAGTDTGTLYVPDHLLSQTANMREQSPVDGSSGDPISRYSMIIQAWGYDQDGAGNSSIRRLHPIRDGSEGTLSLTFTATVSGNYLLVVGGIHPNAALPSPTADYPVTVQVREVTPAPN